MDCPFPSDLPPLCDLDLQDNAPALQAMINRIAAGGGGVLHLPPARTAYRSGPLIWRSGVSLAGRDGVAVLRQATTSMKSVSFSPLWDLKSRSTAMVKDATAVPLLVRRNSGSRVIRPITIILFSMK